MSNLPSMISPTKLEELGRAWKKIKNDVTYVAETIQRYGVTKDTFLDKTILLFLRMKEKDLIKL